MGMEFFEIIRRVGIFIICAQAIVHFRPNDSYEKYFRMLVSIIVLIMILSPVFQLFGNEDISISLEQYDVILDISAEEINSKFNNEEKIEPETQRTEGEKGMTEEVTVPQDETKHKKIETIVINPVEVEQ